MRILKNLHFYRSSILRIRYTDTTKKKNLIKTGRKISLSVKDNTNHTCKNVLQ